MATKHTDFREDLIQTVKDVGQEIIDRAEDIVGEGDRLCALDIRVSMDSVDGMYCPTICVDREYAVRRIIDRLMNPDSQKSQLLL